LVIRYLVRSHQLESESLGVETWLLQPPRLRVVNQISHVNEQPNKRWSSSSGF
jgi:hypothetical protein